VVISVTADGEEKNEGKDAQLVFKGKTVTHKTKDNEEYGTFTADPKKKTFDLTPSDGPKEGTTLKGIYQLKGDELKMCFQPEGKDRPKDFTTEKGSGNVLLILKRVKDKGDTIRKELVPVEGKVTLNGKPLAKALVEFVPVDKRGQKATGITNDNGEYILKTLGTKRGVLLGKYRVAISKKVGGKSVLPARYGPGGKGQLDFEVPSGGTDMADFSLKSR
jgi:uncharacterized protein (TIGR03067 family)